jgi:magnesium and cobalt transporter
MGSTSEGSEAGISPSEAEGEAPRRSFFGRLISGFTSSDTSDEARAEQAVVRGAAGTLGLGNLRNLRVDDVAIPKVEIIAVPSDIGKEDLVEVFRQHGLSRVPIYKGTLDHPLGLLLLKDLALTHGFGATGRFSLKKMMRPILFVPPSMPAATLLQKMQRDRVHMALVIDEYGGVDGLVTIEDLIEVIIGEIEDEHDEDESALWKEERAGVYVVQANAPLEEFEAVVGRSLRAGEEDKEIDTLGGLIFLRTGRVPVRGEVVTDDSGVEFDVLDADPRKIKRVRVRLPGATADVPDIAEVAPIKSVAGKTEPGKAASGEGGLG